MLHNSVHTKKLQNCILLKFGRIGNGKFLFLVNMNFTVQLDIAQIQRVEVTCAAYQRGCRYLFVSYIFVFQVKDAVPRISSGTSRPRIER